jgi:hypothetical protein
VKRGGGIRITGADEVIEEGKDKTAVWRLQFDAWPNDRSGQKPLLWALDRHVRTTADDFGAPRKSAELGHNPILKLR